MPSRATVASLVWLTGALAAGCGGSSPPTAPTGPAPSVPVAAACEAIGTRPLSTTAILNGSACALGSSPVVLLNMRGPGGVGGGACSGTLIGPRAVLTGAHCLDEGMVSATAWLGPPGEPIAAESFTYFPNYSGNNPSTPDVGIVRFAQDLGPTPVPLLTSRDARVGETAVIAGWGRDQSDIPATLRAGTAVLTAVGALHLETRYTTNASSVCSGDSGGPILLSEGGTWAVAGVISATSGTVCNTGTNFYVNLRNAAALAFVLQQAPEAGRR
jgi:hypothetical protein